MAEESAVCTPADVGVMYQDDAPEEVRRLMDAYFAQFIKPDWLERGNILNAGPKCSCGKSLGGFLGTFEWAITWGEGYCVHCQSPIRAHHVIRDRDGEEIVTIYNVPLLYRMEKSNEGNSPRD